MIARAQYEETARRFVRLLEEQDVDAWTELYADDARNHFPFHSDLIGDAMLVGKEAIHAAWSSFPERYERVRLPLDSLFVDEEARTVVMQLSTRNILPGGELFACGLVFVLRFDAAGKVTDYYEYYNPIVTGVAFGRFTVTACG